MMDGNMPDTVQAGELLDSAERDRVVAESLVFCVQHGGETRLVSPHTVVPAGSTVVRDDGGIVTAPSATNPGGPGSVA